MSVNTGYKDFEGRDICEGDRVILIPRRSRAARGIVEKKGGQWGVQFFNLWIRLDEAESVEICENQK